VKRDLGKYKIDLVGVQEARWEKGGTEQEEDYTLFYGEGNENHSQEEDFCTQENHISS
jgi:hypothetical protein